MTGYLIIFFIITFEIIILGVIVSNLEFNIEECYISYNIDIPQKISVKKLKVNIKLYLFKKIRFLKIKIYKNYCEIFKIKLHLDVLKKLKGDKQNGVWYIFKNIGKLKPEVKNINLEIIGGTNDILLTTLLYPAVSTIIYYFLSKDMNVCQENISDCNIKITPTYINTNNVKIIGTTKIHFNTKTVLLFILKCKKSM